MASDQLQPITALSTLQRTFALLDLSSEIRIVDLQQIADVMSGKRNEVSFYRRAEGFIVISRELENLPFPVKGSEEFKKFLNNPNTHMFNAVAFSPLATPPSTLNYWIEPPIKPKKVIGLLSKNSFIPSSVITMWPWLTT